MTKTIELDCQPGALRPGDLLPGVLEGTGIEPVEAGSKLFGNWTFDFSHISDLVWAAAMPIFKERITALYNRGAIRYGSW